MPYQTPKKYQKPDHYAILGVKENANEAEIRKAYKDLAMQWHPDKNPDNKGEAEARFKDITEAHTVLKDHQKRQEYNNLIAGAKEDEQRKRSNQQANPQAAAASSPPEPQSKANATPPFDYDKVSSNLKSLEAGDGIKRSLTPTNPQPKWTSPSSSTALVPADQTALTETTGKKDTYTYTRNDNGQITRATLEVNGQKQQISSGSKADDRAAVELAHQAGWKNLSVHPDLPQDRKDNVKKLCDEYGINFSVRPREGIENKQEAAAAVSPKENSNPAVEAHNTQAWAAPKPEPQQKSKVEEPEPEYPSLRP